MWLFTAPVVVYTVLVFLQETSAPETGAKAEEREELMAKTVAVESTESIRHAVNEAVGRALAKLKREDLKLSFTDLVRLLQLQKEMNEKSETAKAINVKWVNGWDAPKRGE